MCVCVWPCTCTDLAQSVQLHPCRQSAGVAVFPVTRLSQQGGGDACAGTPAASSWLSSPDWISFGARLHCVGNANGVGHLSYRYVIKRDVRSVLSAVLIVSGLCSVDLRKINSIPVCVCVCVYIYIYINFA